MAKIISSYFEATETGGMSHEEYYRQFGPIELELGKSYVQHPGTWQERIFKIVFVGHGVAVGVSEKSNLGTQKQLFTAEGLASGWKHHDNRPSYRLQAMSPKKVI